ncbi:hypothetical protein O181_010126 [Austropuccinia psidii MF-1]|uniref:General transcription and DNA repair factor IIH n=1 Tax=Austropuccinia psidii MF-1 TaxID=1389203 RepID=A0A9Q3GK42_9BASI|nr:hypothetical protein [Austropuccinia psidii MF-1]
MDSLDLCIIGFGIGRFNQGKPRSSIKLTDSKDFSSDNWVQVMARSDDTESEADLDSDWGPETGGKHETSKSNGRNPAKQPQSKKHKKKATAYASKDGASYAWEEEYKRSWDVLREDDSGSLESAVNQLIANQRRRIIRDTSSIQRGIIRHFCLIIDLSLAMTDRDLRPNRLELTLTYAKEFVTEFFDQNPISQLCILITKDAFAEKLSDLSGNPVDHHRALNNKARLTPSGEPSLQNALEMARASFSHLPLHGSREALVIFGSLTTCDPDDINKTIANLEADRMRVSIVGLAAEVRICKEICRRTQGKYGVILNEHHFKDLLFESITPPPTAKTTNQQSGADLIQMGFPNKLSNIQTSETFCACHSKLKSTGFICPRCNSKNCEIPTDCVVCGLTIVSSPHLARSYRHLFPVGNWVEQATNRSNPFTCFGCDKRFQLPPSANSINNNNENNLSISSAYSCGRFIEKCKPPW